MAARIVRLFTYGWHHEWWRHQSSPRIMGNSVMAEESSSHLTTSGVRHICLPIAENLKMRFWSSLQWHNVHAKLHKTPSRHSRVTWVREVTPTSCDHPNRWCSDVISSIRGLFVMVDDHIPTSRVTASIHVGITGCRTLKITDSVSPLMT